MIFLRIEKFSKLKNGLYKLRLEDGSDILVHEDLILKKDFKMRRRAFLRGIPPNLPL